MKSWLRLTMGLIAVGFFGGCATHAGLPMEAKHLEIQPHVQTRHGQSDTEAQYALGKYFLGQGRNAMALMAFARSLENDPTNIEARNAQGITLTRLGDFNSAVEQLQMAAAAKPKAAHIANNLAYALMLKGDLTAAADQIVVAYGLDKSHPRLLANANEIRHRAGNEPALLAKLSAIPLPDAPTETAAVEPPAVHSNAISPGVRRTSLPVVDVSFDSGLAPPRPFLAEGSQPLAVDVATRSTLGSQSLLVATDSSTPPLVPNSDPAPTVIAAATSSLARVRKAAVGGREPKAKDHNTAAPALGADISVPTLVIANGNGVRGLAAAARKRLVSLEVGVHRITNAASFDYKVSTIYFDIVHEAKVASLAGMLPVKPRLVRYSIKGDRPDIELVLGHDLSSLRAIDAIGTIGAIDAVKPPLSADDF